MEVMGWRQTLQSSRLSHHPQILWQQGSFVHVDCLSQKKGEKSSSTWCIYEAAWWHTGQWKRNSCTQQLPSKFVNWKVFLTLRLFPKVQLHLPWYLKNTSSCSVTWDTKSFRLCLLSTDRNWFLHLRQTKVHYLLLWNMHREKETTVWKRKLWLLQAIWIQCQAFFPPTAYCKMYTYFEEEKKLHLCCLPLASLKSQPWLLNSYSLFFPSLSQFISGAHE